MEPFTLEHFREWAGGVVLDNDEPWLLEPFQEAFFSDVFAGFEECWLVIPEGNGKTTALAGLALYHCEFKASAQVPVAASSREQAEVMYRQAEGMVMRSPRLKAIFKCQEGYRRIKCMENGSRIQVFAADDRTGDGIIPTLCLVDELHRHRDLRLYRTWRGKLGKRNAQIATISTAGEPGGEFEQTRERIREAAEAEGSSERDGFFLRAESGKLVLHEYAVPVESDSEDMAVVKAANPFSGVTEDWLKEKRASPSMTRAHWRRFVCNLPEHTAGELYIQGEMWAKCRDPESEILAGAAVCLGMDGSRTFDTTVVAWASKDGDVIDVDCRVFSVRADVAHHTLHLGGRIDFDDVEEFTIDLFDRFEVREAAYDPRYLERSADILTARLRDSRIAAVEPTSKLMREALQTLEKAVVEQRLRHRGDLVVAEHLANTRVERGEANMIRRVAKIDPRKPIDAVPALALAVWRASHARAGGMPLTAVVRR